MYLRLFKMNAPSFAEMGQADKLVEAYWQIVQGASADVNQNVHGESIPVFSASNRNN